VNYPRVYVNSELDINKLFQYTCSNFGLTCIYGHMVHIIFGRLIAMFTLLFPRKHINHQISTRINI
jgi:hypothetical protein